jgi:hypothetical protein
MQKRNKRNDAVNIKPMGKPITLKVKVGSQTILETQTNFYLRQRR